MLDVAFCQNLDRQFDEQSIRTRLRVSWGGGTAKRFVGSVSVNDATFTKPVVLGFSPNSSASLHFGNDEVRIRQLSESSYEGFDIDVVSLPEATIGS